MAFRAFDRSLPSFYLLITRRALWITRKRVPHSLRARWSLRVRPWITASRYPPASLRLLAFFKCWMGYLASAVSNTPPAALPGATRRREARGAGVAGCALRPCPHSHRLSATVQRQGAVSSLRCGPHQPLDPAPSQESFSKHPESLCAAFSRGGPCSPIACTQWLTTGRFWLFSSGAGRQGGGGAAFPALSAGRQRAQRGVSK